MPLLLMCLASTAFGQSRSFLYKPDIHGNEIVFTAEGDLWLSNLKTGVTLRLTSDPGLETNAKFSPDGSEIAFDAAYDGKTDIYVMPTAGGIAKRVTFDPATPTVLGWTPDGKSILFRSSSQFLQPQFYEVPKEGGPVSKLPVPQGYFASIAPDGVTMAYVPDSNEWMNWDRYQAGEADSIWLTNLKDRSFKRITHTKWVDTQPVWVDGDIYFISERSKVRNLWKIDPKTDKAEQITDSKTNIIAYPSTDGSRIVYQDGNGLGIYNPKAGIARKLDIQLHSDRIHARPAEVTLSTGIEAAAVGPTAKRIAVVVRGQLVTVPASTGPMHILLNDASQRVRNPVWSPDGKTIAFISDKSGEEQIWTVPAEGGAKPKQLTTTLTGEHFRPVWSPDGKHLVIGDRTMQIQLVDASTGKVTQIDQADRGGSYDTPNQDYTFSPDSQWVAYSLPGFGWNSEVWLYSLKTGKKTEISDPTIASNSPSFSPDGKYLYMIQQSHVQVSQSAYSSMLDYSDPNVVTAVALAADTPSLYPAKDDEEGGAATPAATPAATDAAPTAKADAQSEAKSDAKSGAKADATSAKKPDAKAPPAEVAETKIDLDGIRSRLIPIPVPAGGWSAVAALDGQLLLVNSSPYGALSGANSSLSEFDIKGKKLSPLSPDTDPLGNSDDPLNAQLSGDGKTVLIKQGPGLQLVPVTPGSPAKPVPLSSFRILIDTQQQWKAVFEESWRIARDFYIDPHMGGVDWNAVRRQCEAELPMVGDRTDLTKVQEDMISQLSTGHCYVGGPNPYRKGGASPASLGAFISWDAKAKAYRIDHILQTGDWNLTSRSPLADVGVDVKNGDYILAVNGAPCTDEFGFDKYLMGTAGHVTSLTISSSPKLTPTRTVNVTPIGSQQGLVYLDWVQSRLAYVKKASNGQIGYVHLSDMSENGAKQFAQMYYSKTEMPGIIVDVRYNGGGFISYNLLSHLATKTIGFFKPRYGVSWRREGWGPLGHVVGITNEWAFSDGELFSEYFKRLHIGPLVGHRTGGGEIGSGNGYTLADGGSIYVPNYGAWSPDGHWLIEGRGAEPDVVVDQDPNLVMQGKDPQLDAAIKIILDELKAHPFKIPTPPVFPNHTGGSRSEQGVANN